LVGKAAYEPTNTVENKQYGAINHTWHNFNMHVSTDTIFRHNCGTFLDVRLQDALQVSCYIRELRRVGLWPLDAQKHQLSTVLEAFNKFEDRDITQTMGFGIFPRNSHCQACVLDTKSKMAHLMDKVLKGCKGLCLDCIYREESGSYELECRIKHE